MENCFEWCSQKHTLLCIIYVNDAPSVVNNLMLMFDDDSYIHSYIKLFFGNDCRHHEDLQDDITQLLQWTATWQLQLYIYMNSYSLVIPIHISLIV